MDELVLLSTEKRHYLSSGNRKRPAACDLSDCSPACVRSSCRAVIVLLRLLSRLALRACLTKLRAKDTRVGVLGALRADITDGCKSGSSIDRATALKVSDSCMAYLVANWVTRYWGEMEPEICQSAGGGSFLSH